MTDKKLPRVWLWIGDIKKIWDDKETITGERKDRLMAYTYPHSTTLADLQPYVPLRELDIANQRIKELRAGLDEIAKPSKFINDLPGLDWEAENELDAWKRTARVRRELAFKTLSNDDHLLTQDTESTKERENV